MEDPSDALTVIADEMPKDPSDALTVIADEMAAKASTWH